MRIGCQGSMNKNPQHELLTLEHYIGIFRYLFGIKLKSQSFHS